MTTVLIVDDSKLARIVVRKALAALEPDWKCVEASSAAQAMAIIGFQPIDVAFIDYNMAGKNGLELLAEMRALNINIPIAIITANLQWAIIDRTRALKATFVPKPIVADKLKAFVDSVEA
jgi:DNA-binding NtrC family response regulator